MPTLTLSRSQRIEQIIQQRQPLAQTLGAIAAGLTGLIDQHQHLQTYRQTLSRGTDILPDLPSIEQIIQLRDRIDTLQKRLSRKTLNIGVIGETGAGKSTLLKSLSNLTDGEIPALAGGACTAVRSTVINQAGETYATVNLHSEQSFLAEVIAPYFEQLKLGSTPRNLDEFAAFPFSDSPPEGASKEKMYQHLRDDYHQNLDRYRHLLNRSEPETITISREQIPSCATQTRDAQGQLTTFTHIGVRELTIYCPFGKDASAFGQVALVDVPGMGDTRLGDEKLMLQTLAQSVDVVLFVHRPDPLRYLWKKTTLSLYETASEALTPFDERVFMLLNYSRNNDNAKACQTLLQNLDPIQVVEASIVDCASQTETQRILDGILNYLTDHIQRLDRQSLRTPISELRTLLKTLPAKIPAAAELFQYLADEQQQFDLLFTGKNGRAGLWGDMTSALIEYRNELRTQREKEANDFKANITSTLERCRDRPQFPEPEQAARETLSEDSPIIIQEIYLRELRAYLAKQFLRLDLDLQGSLESVKAEVAKILGQSGGLGRLSERTGTLFLQDLITRLPLRGDSELRLGFTTLAAYNVSFAGLVLWKVRQPLDYLGYERRLEADEVPDLETLYHHVLDHCENCLQSLYSLPNEIAHSMVEEFCDRIFYAEGVKHEWRSFLWQQRYQLFEPLQKLATLEARQQEWESIVTQFKSTATQVEQLLKGI